MRLIKMFMVQLFLHVQLRLFSGSHSPTVQLFSLGHTPNKPTAPCSRTQSTWTGTTHRGTSFSNLRALFHQLFLKPLWHHRSDESRYPRRRVSHSRSPRESTQKTRGIPTRCCVTHCLAPTGHCTRVMTGVKNTEVQLVGANFRFGHTELIWSIYS